MKFSAPLCLGLICLCLVSSCAPPAGKNEIAAANGETISKSDRKELIARLNESVFCIAVNVKGRDFEKRFSVGTGFLVGDGLIATAAHVQTKALEMPGKFERNQSKTVAQKKFDTGETVEFPIQIVATDERSDLAIYRFDPQVLKDNPKLADVKPPALAENLPPIGEAVLSVGYYAAYEFPFNSIGTVSMIDKGGDDIVSDLTLMPGNSGAPLFSLETGEVLGVTTEVLDLGNETVRFGIARRAAKLRELLRKL